MDIPQRIYFFYRVGYRRIALVKTLQKIRNLKLFVMFAVLKLFFFPNFLKTSFDTDQQRADHLLSQITLQSNDRLPAKGGQLNE